MSRVENPSEAALVSAIVKTMQQASSDYLAVARVRVGNSQLRHMAAAVIDQHLPRWRDIATAPRDGTWVLCRGPDGYGIAKFPPNPVWAEYPEYTDWMPLPTFPLLTERAKAGAQ